MPNTAPIVAHGLFGGNHLTLPHRKQNTRARFGGNPRHSQSRAPAGRSGIRSRNSGYRSLPMMSPQSTGVRSVKVSTAPSPSSISTFSNVPSGRRKKCDHKSQPTGSASRRSASASTSGCGAGNGFASNRLTVRSARDDQNGCISVNPRRTWLSQEHVSVGHIASTGSSVTNDSVVPYATLCIESKNEPL